jgi:hypothetical protein
LPNLVTLVIRLVLNAWSTTAGMGPFWVALRQVFNNMRLPSWEMFTASFTPHRGEYSLMLRRMEGQAENLHPQGTKFTPRGQVHP